MLRRRLDCRRELPVLEVLLLLLLRLLLMLLNQRLQ
jgi:hypothetical protein